MQFLGVKYYSYKIIIIAICSGYGVDAVNALTKAKDEMKLVIGDLKPQIFESMNQTLRNSLDLEDITDFDATAINNIVNKIVDAY